MQSTLYINQREEHRLTKKSHRLSHSDTRLRNPLPGNRSVSTNCECLHYAIIKQLVSMEMQGSTMFQINATIITSMRKFT